MYALKKEETEVKKQLALVQIQLDDSRGIKLFEEYRKAAMPWVEKARERSKLVDRAKLFEFVKQGPLVVRSGAPPRAHSRIDTRRRTAEQRRKDDELYERLRRTKR